MSIDKLVEFHDAVEYSRDKLEAAGYDRTQASVITLSGYLAALVVAGHIPAMGKAIRAVADKIAREESQAQR